MHTDSHTCRSPTHSHTHTQICLSPHIHAHTKPFPGLPAASLACTPAPNTHLMLEQMPPSLPVCSPSVTSYRQRAATMSEKCQRSCTSPMTLDNFYPVFELGQKRQCQNRQLNAGLREGQALAQSHTAHPWLRLPSVASLSPCKTRLVRLSHHVRHAWFLWRPSGAQPPHRQSLQIRKLSVPGIFLSYHSFCVFLN